jgi:hypothetical protein
MADAPQGGGFGASLKAKFGPLPVWAWLGIITVLLLGYWLYEQHKSGAASTGTDTTQGSSAAPGVVVINQDDAGEDEDDESSGGKKKKKKRKKNPKGFPPVPRPPREPHTRQVTVSKDETLRQLATQRHWSANTLRDVERENVTQGGGHFTGKTDLTKGEEVLRPLRS